MQLSRAKIVRLFIILEVCSDSMHFFLSLMTKLGAWFTYNIELAIFCAFCNMIKKAKLAICFTNHKICCIWENSLVFDQLVEKLNFKIGFIIEFSWLLFYISPKQSSNIHKIHHCCQDANALGLHISVESFLQVGCWFKLLIHIS